mmetsp:Transcript_29291/g.98720  ORF Transcript_29291/g.98720 Transcript_29291/m.98720 type:complete len:232 (+) Transcript_29291:146-841(+)
MWPSETPKMSMSSSILLAASVEDRDPARFGGTSVFIICHSSSDSTQPWPLGSSSENASRNMAENSAWAMRARKSLMAIMSLPSTSGFALLIMLLSSSSCGARPTAVMRPARSATVMAPSPSRSMMWKVCSNSSRWYGVSCATSPARYFFSAASPHFGDRAAAWSNARTTARTRRRRCISERSVANGLFASANSPFKGASGAGSSSSSGFCAAARFDGVSVVFKPSTTCFCS